MVNASVLISSMLFAAAPLSAADLPAWRAAWIWQERAQYDGYNDTIEARKQFDLPEIKSAVLRITADTYYRLYVNGEWVNDGPSRSWPEHYQYDVIDVAPYLKPGKNEIRVIAKFFGIGTFHQLPQEAGLLAQLDAQPQQGNPVRIVTDGTWEVREAPAWAKYAPKQSVQLGPFEVYDARNADSGAFTPAVVRYPAGEGPWKNLEPRDCPLLTRKPFALKKFTGANVVKRSEGQTFIFPTACWAVNGVLEANNKCAITGAYATVADMPQGGVLTIDADGNDVRVDGQSAKDNVFTLEPGPHFVFCALTEYFGHWRSDTEIHLKADKPLALKNPKDDSESAPWCFAAFNLEPVLYSDLDWSLLSHDQRREIERPIKEALKDHLQNSATVEGFKSRLADKARSIQPGEWTEASYFLFKTRDVVKDAMAAVQNPEDLLKEGGACTVIPSNAGDVELIYDLGEQNIGFYQFEIDAEAGLVVDIFGVEYIAPDGRVQDTERYRNGMRYICSEGLNRFTSLARRSQQYLFITLRHQSRPATLKAFRLIESTYPVQPVGRFECSDPKLTKTWEISARTLKLCMEDTYTDCPLYEQTLWVGDARNESLLSYTAFGSDDLGKRCLKLIARSLDRYPLIQSQVPSTWEVIIPSFGFLWGIMAWDYYAWSGDKQFVEWIYPYLIKNLRNASNYTDKQGLFSVPFWNFFDWTNIDSGHSTVVYNSILAAGAADAALRCADAIGNAQDKEWLEQYRDSLKKALNEVWNAEAGAYPDSVHEDGKVSTNYSIHNCFLSLLFDVVPEDRKNIVLEKLLNPPKDMTQVGSPFVAMYMFDALEKMGHADKIIEAIHKYYDPMLEAGATTVWESFPSGTTGHGGFPTRSHTHAWSSAPIHFLNRIVLGILPEAPGSASFQISPRLNGLTWAKGATATPKGPVEVSWKMDGTTLIIDAKAPKGVNVHFAPNETLKDFTVVFNGTKQ